MREIANMWEIEDEYINKKAAKKIEKDHSEEYESCFSNAEKVRNQLNRGHKLRVFDFGFLKSEREGVYRIAQTGVKSAREVRLYVYFDEKNEILYLLHIGLKETQPKDINKAKQKARKIKKQGG